MRRTAVSLALAFFLQTLRAGAKEGHTRGRARAGVGGHIKLQFGIVVPHE
jgi:hypothetical protein